MTTPPVGLTQGMYDEFIESAVRYEIVDKEDEVVGNWLAKQDADGLKQLNALLEFSKNCSGSKNAYFFDGKDYHKSSAPLNHVVKDFLKTLAAAKDPEMKLGKDKDITFDYKDGVLTIKANSPEGQKLMKEWVEKMVKEGKLTAVPAEEAKKVIEARKQPDPEATAESTAETGRPMTPS